MATLTVVSDLHLEARPLSLDEILDPNLTSDVLALLGDIGDPSSPAYRDFLAACAARFPTVLLLAGNNEYRNHDGGGRTMAQTEDLIRRAAAAHPNVHFLQNAAHVVGDVAFIGSTLWSYLPDTPLPPPTSDVAEPVKASVAGAAADDARPTAAATGCSAQTQAAGAAGESIAQDAVVELKIAEPSAVTSAKHLGAAAAAPLPPLQQAQQQQGQSEPILAQPPQAAPRHPCATPANVLAVPIPAPRRPTGPSSAVSANSGASSNAPPTAAPTGRPPMAQPRFMSYSTPPSDWLTSQHSSRESSCSIVGCGSGCGGAYGGAGSADAGGVRRGCRRRTLRHCVSLASLRPDEPCPSWRDIQVGRASGASAGGRSGGGGSSSESDARGSDSDSGQSSSDAEQSDVSPPCWSNDSRVQGGGRALDLPAAAAKAAGGSAKAGASGVAAAGAEQRPFRTGGESLDGTPAQSLLSGLMSSTQPATIAGGIAAQAQSAIPAFLSDPGSLPSSSVPKQPASAATAAAAQAPEPSPSPAAGSGIPTPKSRHHHHRSHSHGPPPSTVREFIGATSLDFRRIFASPGGPAITPDDTNAIFAASLAYIRASVAAARQRGLVPVVLSHHAPSMSGTSRPAFAGHPSTHSYSTDLEPYLAGSGVAAWYCGHTHYNFDRILEGDVRLASNQFGSQPKPADGYSRTWQHTLPTASGCNTSSDATAAAAADKPAPAEHPHGAARPISLSLSSDVSLGAPTPALAIAWAY